MIDKNSFDTREWPFDDSYLLARLKEVDGLRFKVLVYHPHEGKDFDFIDGDGLPPDSNDVNHARSHQNRQAAERVKTAENVSRE